MNPVREIVSVAEELVASDANMAFDSKMRDVRRKMRQLSDQIDRLERRQRGDQSNTEMVTKLFRVEGLLDDVMRFTG